MPAITKLEHAKRLRIVQEWIVDDNPVSDIVAQCVQKWGISDRQAERYIKAAREAWVESDDHELEEKRSTRIQALKKLRRSLKESHRGTPSGIRALLAVDKEISKLEGTAAPKRVEMSGPGGKALPVDLTGLGVEDLKLLLGLKRKLEKKHG